MPANARVQFEVAARRDRVLRLRAAGATFQQIADEIGLPSANSAIIDLRRALEARGRDLTRLAGQDFALELERLDTLERAAQSVMRQAMRDGRGYDPKLALRAIDRLQRISAGRRRLLGLDRRQASDGDDGERSEGFVDEISQRRERRRRAKGW